MEDDARLFERNLERLARRRIGQTVTLDYRLSPYHGQPARVVDVQRLRDGTIVYSLTFADGFTAAYTRDKLVTDDPEEDTPARGGAWRVVTPPTVGIGDFVTFEGRMCRVEAVSDDAERQYQLRDVATGADVGIVAASECQ